MAKNSVTTPITGVCPIGKETGYSRYLIMLFQLHRLYGVNYDEKITMKCSNARICKEAILKYMKVLPLHLYDCKGCQDKW
jgi:hypothetical protein